MGVIVIEGIVITVLVLVGLREAIMNAVPLALKRAIGVGIGLFILFIGFVNGGLIVSLRSAVMLGRRSLLSRRRGTLRLPIGLALTVVLWCSRSGPRWSSASSSRRSSRSSSACQRSRPTLNATPNFSTLGHSTSARSSGRSAARPRS